MVSLFLDSGHEPGKFWTGVFPPSPLAQSMRLSAPPRCLALGRRAHMLVCDLLYAVTRRAWATLTHACNLQTKGALVSVLLITD